MAFENAYHSRLRPPSLACRVFDDPMGGFIIPHRSLDDRVSYTSAVGRLDVRLWEGGTPQWIPACEWRAEFEWKLLTISHVRSSTTGFPATLQCSMDTRVCAIGDMIGQASN